MFSKITAVILFFSLIFTSYAVNASTIVGDSSIVFSGENLKDSLLKKTSEAEPKWFEQIKIRGYVQARYNRLLETNPDLKCEQCDRSWGEDGGFFLRRVRIILYGQINKRVYFYIQPDFASSAGTTSQIGQIRDAYFDLGIDAKNEFRFRIGQSKIPFGFENMQSSQNRLALDRNDALNSALSNERDLGAFFYWAPTKRRELFASLVKDGLKGSGDYGCFAFGMYNGQTANQTERNNKLHSAARFTWPFQVKSQIIEASLQAYTGKFVLLSTTSGVKKRNDAEYLDQRVAASFILYPKPFGIQAEYNIGQGPQFDKLSDSIITGNVEGGYVLMNCQLKFQNQLIIPFARAQYFSGGKKHELDARYYHVNEYEIGVEWQPNRNFELVAMYTISSRRFEDFAKQDNLQKGRLLRLQAQINF